MHTSGVVLTVCSRQSEEHLAQKLNTNVTEGMAETLPPLQAACGLGWRPELRASGITALTPNWLRCRRCRRQAQVLEDGNDRINRCYIKMYTNEFAKSLPMCKSTKIMQSVQDTLSSETHQSCRHTDAGT